MAAIEITIFRQSLALIDHATIHASSEKGASG
jgi:hypothetical protein